MNRYYDQDTEKLYKEFRRRGASQTLIELLCEPKRKESVRAMYVLLNAGITSTEHLHEFWNKYNGAKGIIQLKNCGAKTTQFICGRFADYTV